MNRLLAELKRRRVLRAVALYIVGAWVAIQVASTLVPILELPDWVPRLVVALAAIGLPVVIALAWALDLTRAGLQRTPDAVIADPADPSTVVLSGTMNVGRIAVAGAVAVLALAGGAFVLLPTSEAELIDRRVVVDALENRTGEASLDAVGAMAGDWIVQGVQRVPAIDVVAASSGFTALQDDEAAPAGERGRRATALARELGARLVVSGSYYVERDTLRLIAEVTDARRDRRLHTTEPVRADRNAPSAGLDTLRDRVTTFLALWFDEADLGIELTGDQVSVLPSLEAYQQYAAGNRLFNQGRYRDAIPYYDAAIALDSSFFRAIGAAAVSYTNISRFDSAAPYVAMLTRMRGRLSPWQVLHVDWLEANQRDDLPGQLAAARRAAEAMPNSFEWGYLVAAHSNRLNRPAEAVARLEALDPEVAREWRPFWTHYTSALHYLGRHADELRIIERARTQHPDYVPYQNYELHALAALGRMADVLARLPQVEANPDPTTALFDIALELDVHGHAGAARQVVDRLLTWYGARPVADTVTRVQRQVQALALAFVDRNAEARTILEQLVDDAPASLVAHGDLGWIAARMGDTVTANDAVAWLDTAQMPRMRGLNHVLQARIAAESGDADRAVTLLRNAFTQGRPFERGYHRDFRLRRLRGHAGFDELMRPKG